jgi:hypothetical protein
MTRTRPNTDPGVKPTLTPGHPKRETTNEEYIAMLRRLLRSLSRRVGDADLVALGEMAGLRDELDGHIIDAVARLRHDVQPASWAEIGRAFGISRQAAQERFGKVGGSRRPGGQPAHLR